MKKELKNDKRLTTCIECKERKMCQKGNFRWDYGLCDDCVKKIGGKK